MTDASSQNTEEQTETETLPETRPRIFFKSITFQDGTEIKLGNNDIVVFVGGNSSGKSRTLIDLENYLSNPSSCQIISRAESIKSGTSEALLQLIKKNSIKDSYGHHSGYKFSINLNSYPSLKDTWDKNQFNQVSSLFCRRIGTRTRIIDSDKANIFPTRTQPPTTPLQFLYTKRKIEEKISQYFEETFKKDLIVDRGAGSEIPLLVGKKAKLEKGEQILDETYTQRQLNQAMPLEEQGDGMRSFASVILQTLADPVPSILLLDEPEAFLHPPQAKILGRLLATERPRDAQLFIATHSVDILMGLLEAAPENLHIIRLDRSSKPYAVELNKDKAKAIMDDPFLRHSKLLSALFYKRVIICEAESDCLFYQVILDSLRTQGVSDTLFIPAGGKDKLYKLADIIKALRIPVEVIADLDILNNGGDTFETTIKTLGGEQAWATISPLWNSVKSAIENHRVLKTAEQVEQDIHNALKKLKSKKASFPEEIDKEIRIALKNASPWGYVKTAGQSVIPHGEAMEKWHELQKACARINLWLVPVGELESFCRTGKGHGSEWIHDILTRKDLNTNEFETARKFIKAVWDNKPEDLN